MNKKQIQIWFLRLLPLLLLLVKGMASVGSDEIGGGEIPDWDS